MGNFRFDRASVNGIELHYAACGDSDAPLMLFLHGFPEYWAGWQDVMPHFSGTHYCVAPDQRGYNLSSKPHGVEQYAPKHLVEDVRQLAKLLSPDRPFVLAGHDWGASVAYAFAMRHADRVERLVIANGVHPGPFQTALLNDRGQIEASQYFHLLRSDKAERVLSENSFERLFGMLGGFSDVPFLDVDTKAAYAEAWGQPGALTGMINWYRASPIHVPQAGKPVDADKALVIDTDRLQIVMPHLLIYGVEDRALRPAAFNDIETFAPQVERHDVAGAGHWILHEKPDLVAEITAGWLKS